MASLSKFCPRLWELLLSVEELKNLPAEIINLFVDFLFVPRADIITSSFDRRGTQVYSLPRISPVSEELTTAEEQEERLQECKWQLVTKLPDTIAGALVMLDKCIYSSGGCGLTALATSITNRYDLVGREWKELSNMTRPRSCHTITACSGLLYVCGGTDGGVQFSDSCEVFDPLKNTWTLLPSMKKERAAHLAVGYDNKIYCFGGARREKTAEMFDTKTQQWNLISPLSCTVHCGFAVVLSVECILIIGDDSVLFYNPRNDTWSEAKWKLPENRRFFSACLISGNRLLLSGKSVASLIEQNDSFVLDLTTEKWSKMRSFFFTGENPMSSLTFSVNPYVSCPQFYAELQSMKELEQWPTALFRLVIDFLFTLCPQSVYTERVSGKIFVLDQTRVVELPIVRPYVNVVIYNNAVYILGSDEKEGVATVECYTISNNQSFLKERKRVPGVGYWRDEQQIIVWDGKFYVCGGYVEGPKGSCEVYDPVSNAWKNIPSMMLSRVGHAGVEYQGKIYIFGGGYCGADDTAEMFDIKLQQWASITKMFTKRWYSKAVVLNNYLDSSGSNVDYIAVMGGYAYNEYTDAVDLYDPHHDSWSKATWKLPGPRHSFSAQLLANGDLFIFGGYDEKEKVLTTGFTFNLLTQKWTQVC